MGTLFGGATGACILAGLVASAYASLEHASPPVPKTGATANSALPLEIPDPCGEIRVISKRAISSLHGILVFGNAAECDSVVLEQRVLAQLNPGDLVGDSEGIIER